MFGIWGKDSKSKSRQRSIRLTTRLWEHFSGFQESLLPMTPLEEAELQALLKSDQGYDMPGFGIMSVFEVGKSSQEEMESISQRSISDPECRKDRWRRSVLVPLTTNHIYTKTDLFDNENDDNSKFL